MIRHERSHARHRRPGLACVLPLVALGVLMPAALAQTPSAASFDVAPCHLRDVDPAIAPRLQCGSVVVPRDHAAPGAGVFRLAVTIVKTVSPARQPDPVVYVAGGQGPPLTVRAVSIARRDADVLAPDRDLILVDQRGSGRSEPLLCPDLTRQQIALFAAGADAPDLLRAWRDTYGICRIQMVDDGVKPAWFGSDVSAADLESVRQALGLDRWNVYAVSYGTSIAMAMMAQHPERLRAVVLDSVWPPDPLPMTLSQTFQRALDLLFDACRADASCATAHPDLPAAFAEARRGLDAEALTIPMVSRLGPQMFRLRATAFGLIVDRLLYSRAGMAALPAFIDAVRRRDSLTLQPLIAGVAEGYASMSAGAMAAVECRERPSWRTPAPVDARPFSAFVAGMCEHWSPAGPPPLMPADTSVPSLLLAGRRDPLTPPPFAQAAAATMGPKAQVVEFANVGHGVEPSSPCGEAVVTAFMRDPTAAPAAACADQVEPITFR